MPTPVAFQSTTRMQQWMALVLLLAIGVEFTDPFIGQAQVQPQPPANGTTEAPAIINDIAPIQEVEIIEERRPYYKKWWFWTLVGVVVAGGVAAALTIGKSNGDTAPSGGVTVRGPSP